MKTSLEIGGLHCSPDPETGFDGKSFEAAQK
jgi:hypothetical protein